MFELSNDPDVTRFEKMALLLHQRRESLKMAHQSLSLTEESKRRLNKALCAEFDALIVAEAQKIVDNYNPDGTPKENCNENYRAER